MVWCFLHVNTVFMLHIVYASFDDDLNDPPSAESNVLVIAIATSFTVAILVSIVVVYPGNLEAATSTINNKVR